MEQKRIALVTGANRGIGLEVCRQLADKGLHVILTSRDKQKGRRALESIQQAGYRLEYHQLDVGDSASIEQLVNWLRDTHGRLDVLVNNAGINYDTWQQASDADLQECRETLETNLFAPWQLCQAIIPLMKQQSYGRIVNVSSGSGQLNGMGGGTPGYSISKAALNVLTIKLAAELGKGAILVNAVGPGWVRTDMGGPNASRSVEEGATGIVWAATLPADGPTGGFFRDGNRLEW